jgi:enediyne biosynthesis protein E4
MKFPTHDSITFGAWQIQRLLGSLSLWAVMAGCNRPPVTTVAAATSLPAPAFRLVEVARERGINFQHSYGSREPITIVEAMGSGCAFLDFDNDGWLDVFLVNAGDDFRKSKQQPGSKLFHNRRTGQFEEVTARSGIVIDGYAMGCCVGDFDNDGRDDLFVSGFAQNWLFRNRGAGRFEDVTRKAGILRRPGAWGMGCAFVDVNRDGLLDLYVANYIRYDDKIALCRSADVLHGCTPNQYATQRNELYINRGNGKFVERAVALGADDPAGAGLGVVVSDFDEDGWPDIFIANDGTPNALLHNQKGRFRNIAQQAGVAFSEDGGMRAGMGTDAADYNGDGHFDLTITNFQHEPTSLYQNNTQMQFTDVSYPSGVGTPSLNRLKFGVVFVDLDGDGKLDLYVGNGHVYDNVHKFDDSATFEQIDQVYLNRGGRFEEVIPSAGAFPATLSVTRAVAAGDFNNDGAPDLLINSLGRPVRLLENRRERPARWIGLKLEGKKSNRNAIGARVELQGADGLQVREVRSGSSYLGQSDLRVLFSVTEAATSDALILRIRWPSGFSQTIKTPEFNRYITIREP